MYASFIQVPNFGKFINTTKNKAHKLMLTFAPENREYNGRERLKIRDYL